MNRSDCPERKDAVIEINSIAKQTKLLLPSAKISTWDKVNWGVALTLALGGLAAAPFSGGASLVLTILGVVWLLIDMVKKISETARDKKTRTDADQLYERLAFLAWCLQGKL